MSIVGGGMAVHKHFGEYKHPILRWTTRRPPNEDRFVINWWVGSQGPDGDSQSHIGPLRGDQDNKD